MADYLVYIVGIPIIIALLITVVIRVRALNARIRQHFEDEANGVVDPYEQMATLARVEEAIQQHRKFREEAKKLLGVGRKSPPDKS